MTLTYQIVKNGIPKAQENTLLAILSAQMEHDESLYTLELMQLLSHIRSDRTMDIIELSAVCHWKSPRAIRLIESNNPNVVKCVTEDAFGATDETIRMRKLTELRGVSIPMASSILTLVWPERYGVIDIRVWQLLYSLGEVNTKPIGQGFTVANWENFLIILRDAANYWNRTVRSIEKTLFEYHKVAFSGALYKHRNHQCTNQ